MQVNVMAALRGTPKLVATLEPRRELWETNPHRKWVRASFLAVRLLWFKSDKLAEGRLRQAQDPARLGCALRRLSLRWFPGHH